MRLRTQIFGYLFLFGLAPLAIALALTVPLLFSQLELFFHRAHLQNLRADFRDLDQHIAGRNELVRILARLPEPGVVLRKSEGAGDEAVSKARTQYTVWINGILGDQLDLVRIVFVDGAGAEQFWLERNPRTLALEPTTTLSDPPPATLATELPLLPPGGVVAGRVRVIEQLPPRAGIRTIDLRLAAPIAGPAGPGRPAGAVLATIDIGGLARAYPDTLWVLDDGTYFAGVEPGHVNVSAFADFPGLADTFARNEVALWRGRGQQSIIWVPILITEGGEPVWVGRRVDPSPLAEIRSAFEWRVALVVTLLLAAILVVARWRATATDRINRRLSDGVQRMIEHAEPVRFDLPGPQEIRELGERLSSLAAEHAEQVDAARARAEALDRSYRHKSQFLANVSHELRTPLNSILLLSKLLAESPGGMDNAQHRQAGVIHSAAKDLRSLIDDVLELSQIEAGKAHLNLNEASPVQIVAELAELVRPQFDAKRLSFRTETAADLPAAIYTDVDKLRQILKNFLANAAKFTEKGEVVLSATVRSDLDRPSLRFAVRDTGIGIARSQQQLIFEPFRQADGSTSRRFGGTGLGLSISRELTALLDGRIELESEPGHGSTFAVTIPLRHGEGAAGGEPITERVDEVPAGEVVPSANLGLRQVLVVAAAFERLLALTGWIESWGAEVTGAGDAAECFEALDDPPAGGYELLVVDAQGLDAQGLLADLRRHPSGGGLSVVAIGFGRDDDMRVNTVDEPLTAAAVLDAIREFVPESARV